MVVTFALVSNMYVSLRSLELTCIGTIESRNRTSRLPSLRQLAIILETVQCTARRVARTLHSFRLGYCPATIWECVQLYSSG